MEGKLNIRSIKVEDYDFINKWWVQQGFDPPGIDILPMDGFGGVVVEKEKPIAAAYVYLTNSKMGYIDDLISDPKYFGRDRFEILLALIKACENVAKDANCREVWAMSESRGILERCEALGYSVSKRTYGLIFANKKKN